MALIQMVGLDPSSFADGLDVASYLVHNRFTSRDPVLLREAAESLYVHATTPLELGLAAGLRLAAEDEAEDLQKQDAFVVELERFMRAAEDAVSVREVGGILLIGEDREPPVDPVEAPDGYWNGGSP
jgi:hypothetical protein